MRDDSTLPAPKLSASGSQTLLRGLDLIEAVMAGPATLAQLCPMLNLNRSTVHRLASSLVQRGYLRFVPREGYSLGAKLLVLGHAARRQIDLSQAAWPHLQALSDETEDAVHLGVLDHSRVLYLEKLPGRRRIEIRSRIGERQSLATTGLGRALLLDASEADLRAVYEGERADGVAMHGELAAWLKDMRAYQQRGATFDVEENEDRIRCVGAAIRDASGAIIAAISVSSAAQYMSDTRMQTLAGTVRETADAISRDLGWEVRDHG